MAFTFDASTLGGVDVVVFEYLYKNNYEITTHTDIDDENQTVNILNPVIGTTVTDDYTGQKTASIDYQTTIIDTVSYENLMPGKTYTLRGTLMNKDTASPLLIDGKEVISEIEFTPEESSGTVEMVFTFDARSLMDQDLVVFEYLIKNGYDVTKHTDIEDEGQTITLIKPEIRTTATNNATGGKEIIAQGNVAILDTVAYKNLIGGKTYVMKGILMDKSINQPLLVNGNQVTSEMKFTPESPDGTVELEFVFNADNLVSLEVVVFESLYRDDNEITSHADINDMDQTVRFKTLPRLPSTGDVNTSTHIWYTFVAILFATFLMAALIYHRQ